MTASEPSSLRSLPLRSLPLGSLPLGSLPLGSLQRRIDRLERSNRRYGLTVVAMVAAACLAATQVNIEANDVIRAKHFQLVDADGKVRAELRTDKNQSAGLFLVDAKGRTRATLTHDQDQTALFLKDDTETVRVGAAQFAHGGGGFALHGPKSKGAAALYFKKEGSLTFYSAEGKATHRVPDHNARVKIKK